MILVIGATGTVGTEVVKQLVDKGEPTRALVRSATTARQRLDEDVELIEGDLDRTETVTAALSGVDRVFLVTRQDDRQVEWEERVIDAAADAHVGHVVKLSVFRADRHSPLQIARQHGQIEEKLEQSDLDVTIIRPVFFMQNLLTMMRPGVLATAARDGRVAMVDARDIAAVAVTALTSDSHSGNTYTLTGPEAVTFDEVAKALSQRLGTTIPHVRVHRDAVRHALQAAGMPTWFADDMGDLHEMLAAGYEDVTTTDVLAVTGRPPRTLEQFASDVARSLAAKP
jgi:uncharacterized protein YbjT (DUF2867 family)